MDGAIDGKAGVMLAIMRRHLLLTTFVEDNWHLNFGVLLHLDHDYDDN